MVFWSIPFYLRVRNSPFLDRHRPGMVEDYHHHNSNMGIGMGIGDKGVSYEVCTMAYEGRYAFGWKGSGTFDVV